MSEYKAQKEAFVSDNLGQSLSQINGISIIALVSLAKREGHDEQVGGFGVMLMGL